MLLAWSIAALAADPTVGGTVQPVLVVDLPDGNDQPYEDQVEQQTWARGWAAGELPRGDRWFLEARFQSHLGFGEQTDNSGERIRGWWEGSLGDSGWDGKVFQSVRAKVGVLTERWGRLDLLPVADVINPRDLRSGPLLPTEFQRMPIPMGVVSFGTDAIQAETVLIPFATADRLWLRDEDWSYIREGMIEGEIEEIDGGYDQNGDPLWDKPGESGNIIDELKKAKPFPLPDSLRRGLDATVNGRNLPEELLYNGEIAERIQLHAQNLDLSLMAGTFHTRQPVAFLKPKLEKYLRTRTLPDPFTDIQQVVLKPPVGPLVVNWPRTAVVGADGAFLAGPVQIRAETMYQSEHPVRMWYGDSTSVPQLAAGVGADYVRGASLVVTLESRWQHLMNPPDTCDLDDAAASHTDASRSRCLLLAVPDEVQIAGGARVTAARNKLTVQVGGAYDFSFSEYFIKPTVGWRFGDHVNAEVGALLLGGATPAPTSLEDALTYTGGPASYFSQNDALTFAVSLIH